MSEPVSNRELAKRLIITKRNNIGDSSIFNNMIWHAFTNRESVAPIEYSESFPMGFDNSHDFALWYALQDDL